MHYVLFGGSGQIGTLLAREWSARDDQVTVVSRKKTEGPWNWVFWDGVTSGAWEKALEGADVVINLAGRSVDCRYNSKNRTSILNSRVDSTRAIGKAISNSPNPPKLWLQSSTATIYCDRRDAPNDEFTGILGGSEPMAPKTWAFSIKVAKAWEDALAEASLPATRRVALRSAMVMSPDRGGVFSVLLRLVRLGLGGTMGDGGQYVSWIHDHDFIRAIDFLIKSEHISGPVNLAAPLPLPNARFMRTLRDAWGQKIGLPATSWMLEVGALFLRTETELILKSRRVIPGILQKEGFEFQFPDWASAAADLCRRWRGAVDPKF
jgi:uncharacterized protein (TIGR01777 family)